MSPHHDHPLNGRPLGRRETEVARAMASGLGNKEIAELFTISPHTVRNQIRTIYRKVNVGNRAQFIIYAVKAGLLCDLCSGPCARLEENQDHG